MSDFGSFDRDSIVWTDFTEFWAEVNLEAQLWAESVLILLFLAGDKYRQIFYDPIDEEDVQVDADRCDSMGFPSSENRAEKKVKPAAGKKKENVTPRFDPETESRFIGTELYLINWVEKLGILPPFCRTHVRLNLRRVRLG